MAGVWHRAMPSLVAACRSSCRSFNHMAERAPHKPPINSHHVLVEEVQDHVGQTRAGPVAVDQQQLPQVFKPGDGKVTRHDGLGRDTAEHHNTYV